MSRKMGSLEKKISNQKGNNVKATLPKNRISMGNDRFWYIGYDMCPKHDDSNEDPRHDTKSKKDSQFFVPIDVEELP